MRDRADYPPWDSHVTGSSEHNCPDNRGLGLLAGGSLGIGIKVSQAIPGTVQQVLRMEGIP